MATFRTLGLVVLCELVLAAISGAPVPAEQQKSAQRQEQEQSAAKKMTEQDKKVHELSAEFKKAEQRAQAELNRRSDDLKKPQGMDKAIENPDGLYERMKAAVEGKDKTT